MIWDDADQYAMRRIFALVWVTCRLAYAWPAALFPHPAHGPSSLDDRYVRPVIRSWIGVGVSTPHPPVHSLKGATMRKHTLTVSALLLASLTGCAAASTGVGAPTPTPTLTWAAPHSLTQALACQEDDPCWDCHTMGDLVCGHPSAEDTAAGWAAWDYSRGAASLHVDPSRPFRVDFVGTALDYPRRLDADSAAIVGKDGRWYVFHAAYTDKLTGP